MTRRRHLPGLDGLRAVGALFVLSTHVGFHSGDSLNSSFNGLLSRMDSGVTIFFVISGFLLYQPHVEALVHGRRRPSTRRYFLHRALRILPALWVAVIGAALVLPHDEDVSLRNYLLHASLTQIYVPGHETNGLTQMWSLATEAAFYLALPLLAWVLARSGRGDAGLRRRALVLCATPLVGAAWMALANGWGRPLWTLWLPAFIGWFGLGMALAAWRVGRATAALGRSWIDTLAEHPGTAWAVAAALYLVLASPVAGPYDLLPPTAGQAAVKNLLYGLFGVLIVLPAVAPRPEGAPSLAIQVLGSAPARFLGNISYGIFCYHLIALGLVERMLDFEIFTGGFARLFWPTLGLSLVLATVSYYLMERPIMRLGRRRSSSADRPARGPGDLPDSDGDAATATGEQARATPVNASA
ncbi:MAG: acyltransferase [Pedococcus sp.]